MDFDEDDIDSYPFGMDFDEEDIYPYSFGMDFGDENIYPYPHVICKTSPDNEDDEYIISSDVLDIDISEPIGEWESIAFCSPVLEAWGRWEPAVKYSVDRALGTFSSNKATIEKVIDYMTGRMIKVTSEELFRLIRLADILLIKDLHIYCQDRIEKLPLTKHNFYKILQACSLYGFEHEQLDKYIRGNLTELCKGTDILNIDAESVEMLLTDEELCYWPMEARFELIRDWSIAHSSTTLFDRWFNFLNLNKLEIEYLENVLKSNSLVQMSRQCLQRLSDHLSFREDNPVPFVFILNDQRQGSNVVGVNLEDMQLYRFNFPESLMDTVSVPRTVVTGEILAFNRSKQRVYTYDINDGTCKGKRIVIKEHYPSNISHILETNKGIVIISSEERKIVDRTSRWKRAVDSYKRGSVLYQTTSDNGKVLQIEPLMSLLFEVSCACYNQSMIVMTLSTYSMRSEVYCFSLQTNKMTEVSLPFNNSLSMVKSIVPMHDKILMATRSTFRFLSIDNATSVYKVEDKINLNLTSRLQGNPRFAVLSDFLVELDEKSVILHHKNSEQKSFREWNSCKLKTFNISHYKPITCGYVKRTKPVCHYICPHCDPNAKEKEEAEELLREEEMWKIEMPIIYVYGDCDIFDYDDYDNHSDVYNDDPWNHREMIWDGSADEFVEAWW